MLKSGELNHGRFEELCALAALGQISGEEFEELQFHLRSCSFCRARYADFMEILHEHLPLLDPQVELFADSPKISFHHSSYKQRFLQRARREGITFSDVAQGERKKTGGNVWSRFGGQSWTWHPPTYALVLTLLVLILIIGVMGQRLRESLSRHAEASGQVARLDGEIAKLKLRVRELAEPESSPKSQAQPLNTVPPGKELATGVSRSNLTQSWFQTQLSVVRHDYAMAVARSRTLNEHLKKASLELASLRSELTAVRSQIQQPDRLRETELALRQTTEELEKLRRDRSADVSTITAQQAHIRELTEKLSSQAESLERERELLAAGRDIRDLMGARNLHIIDVADVDSTGTRRPFGRVFYTEGKSLIFYAYDLEKKKSLEKFSFQAWGQRESRAGSVQSLGVFFADDRTQNRWVLKYDDPTVLAQIDAVFVTIEPKGGSMKPKGEQLMYAYLKANPNHP
jgi:hypothetical protein